MVEEEARLLEEILITSEPDHSQRPVTSTVASLPSWARYDDAPLLMDYPEEFEDKPRDLFERPRKRPQQTLEQLLATLTPLDQVRSQPFLPHQKRRRFTAYDPELRLYKVIQTSNQKSPTIVSTGTTAHDMLAKLRGSSS
ncbi:hypothetical protein KQX54_008767 [Cotesia glomerata]|uniref:Uncharacterized protein n=1 Tax=Cotesia glomerata TaxID=32391 RepID=A0AAV7IGP8_COTGL|nr:hypothetical protein KQX54_008767 [Cotesia glomerata]